MKVTKKQLKKIIKEELNNVIQEQSHVLLTVDSGGNVYKGDGQDEPLGLNFSNYEKEFEDEDRVFLDYTARNQFLKDLDAIDKDLSHKVGSPTAGPIVKLPDGKLRGLRKAVSQFATTKPQPPKPEPKPDPPKEYKDQSVIDALLAVENDDQALRAMIKDIMDDPDMDTVKISFDPRISANKKIQSWISGAIYGAAETAYRKRKGPGVYVGD